MRGSEVVNRWIAWSKKVWQPNGGKKTEGEMAFGLREEGNEW